MKQIITATLILFFSGVLFAQNPDFERRYGQAYSFYEKGQFEKARTAISNTLNNLPSLSSEQVKLGQKLLTLCEQAIYNRDKLEFDSHEIVVEFQGGADSIVFQAGTPAAIKVSSPGADWFEIKKVGETCISYIADFNPHKEPRKTEFKVSRGKTTKTIKVVQNARPETRKNVEIRTVPDRARITVNDSPEVTGRWREVLASGSYKIHAEKDGYYPKDTIISVADDLQLEQTQEIVIYLSPQFAKLRLDVSAQEGFSFDAAPVVSINGVTVSSPEYPYHYDADRDLQRYSYYSDGTVPVPAGLLDIVVSSKNFEAATCQIQAKAGKIVPVTVELKAVSGFLTLIADEDTQDANVYIDGKLLGCVSEVRRKRVLVGEHLISLSKEGYVSKESQYRVRINEGESAAINVAMLQFRPYVFTSDPSSAIVKINGEIAGYTPTNPIILKEPGRRGAYDVEIVKDGYINAHLSIAPSFTSRDTVLIHSALIPAHEFSFAADENLLNMVVKDSRKGDTLFVNKGILPLKAGLPWRNKPFYYEVYRIGFNQPAYRGTFKFYNGSKNYLNIRTWSRNNVNVLGFNYTLGLLQRPSFSLQHYEDSPYSAWGTINVFSFKMFPGLSTSTFRANLFSSTKSEFDIEKDVIYKKETITFKNVKMLPAMTIVFLNGDFRIGGGLTDDIDINALASYAWYPTFLHRTIGGISHISGHDLFCGAEISSRLSYFNVNLRAGMQMYYQLRAHLYDRNYSESLEFENDYYTTAPVDIPSMFVVQIGFTLGGKDSKGNNILRIF